MQLKVVTELQHSSKVRIQLTVSGSCYTPTVLFQHRRQCLADMQASLTVQKVADLVHMLLKCCIV